MGEARLALLALQGQLSLPAAQLQAARLRLERPTPRIALGLALRGIASAAIDLSDGLAGDLRHLANSSNLGLCLNLELIKNNFYTKLIAYNAINLKTISEIYSEINNENIYNMILTGGDDYELAFTAAPQRRGAVQQAAIACGTRVSRIGQIETQTGLRITDASGQAMALTAASFDHFAA